MAVVWIPCTSSDPVKDIAYWLHNALLERGMETMVLVVQGKLAIRISVQVYNEPQDYVQLCHAVMEILELPTAPASWTEEFMNSVQNKGHV
jgi:hypothetical protein